MEFPAGPAAWFLFSASPRLSASPAISVSRRDLTKSPGSFDGAGHGAGLDGGLLDHDAAGFAPAAVAVGLAPVGVLHGEAGIDDHQDFAAAGFDGIFWPEAKSPGPALAMAG